MHTLWIAGAILVVVIVRRFSRIAGSALGMALSLVVGGWGIWVYRHGGGLNLLGFEITAPMFLSLIALWLGLEWLQLRQQLKKRRRLATPSAPHQPDNDDETGEGDDIDDVPPPTDKTPN